MSGTVSINLGNGTCLEFDPARAEGHIPARVVLTIRRVEGEATNVAVIPCARTAAILAAFKLTHEVATGEAS